MPSDSIVPVMFMGGRVGVWAVVASGACVLSPAFAANVGAGMDSEEVSGCVLSAVVTASSDVGSFSSVLICWSLG